MLKIGISLYDGYKEYLDKLASDNHISITKVCSLICANFLSYNMNRGVYPRFQKFVKIVFDEVSKGNSYNNSNSDLSGSLHSDSQRMVEEEPTRSREEILKDLEFVDIPDDPESSFFPDSED